MFQACIYTYIYRGCPTKLYIFRINIFESARAYIYSYIYRTYKYARYIYAIYTDISEYIAYISHTIHKSEIYTCTLYIYILNILYKYIHIYMYVAAR